MNKWFATVSIVVLLGGTAAYFLLRPATDAVPVPAPVAEAPATSPASAEPQVRFPVPALPEAAPLPPLGESDPAMRDTLAGLYGRDALARFLAPDEIIRRFVATIDNLPRKVVAARLMPVKPVPGPFQVSGAEGNARTGVDNALRYRPYVLAVEAGEAKGLVAAYVRFYPLFQQAYRDLGYPGGNFNDRLVDAIDDLLAAPDVPTARLIQPKVLYQYADADLEARSAGQKIMMRMGPANAARVKDKLRAIRRELTGQVLN